MLYKVRRLVSKSKWTEMGHLVPTKAFYSRAQKWPCCFHPAGAPTHLPLSHPSAHAERIPLEVAYWSRKFHNVKFHGIVGQERVKHFLMSSKQGNRNFTNYTEAAPTFSAAPEPEICENSATFVGYLLHSCFKYSFSWDVIGRHSGLSCRHCVASG